MIRIQITPTSLSATGHAGYNPGNDIVCAAVSALVQTFEASFYEGRKMEYDKTKWAE